MKTFSHDCGSTAEFQTIKECDVFLQNVMHLYAISEHKVTFIAYKCHFTMFLDCQSVYLDDIIVGVLACSLPFCVNTGCILGRRH